MQGFYKNLEITIQYQNAIRFITLKKCLTHWTTHLHRITIIFFSIQTWPFLSQVRLSIFFPLDFLCHFSESMENWKTTLEMCAVNSCKKWSRNWWLFLWKKAGVVRVSFLVPFQRESLQNPLKHMGSSIGPIGWTYMYVCASGFTCRGRRFQLQSLNKSLLNRKRKRKKALLKICRNLKCVYVTHFVNNERTRGSLFFVCSKKLSDSFNFRNYFPRIDQIPLRKLFFKFEPNRTTFYYIQKSCYISLFTEWLT